MKGSKRSVLALSIEEILFLEKHCECWNNVGTASSFSSFLGFVPINSALKSRLKQCGSKCSEHIKTVSGIFFLFKLCNHFFFTSSLLDGRR